MTQAGAPSLKVQLAGLRGLSQEEKQDSLLAICRPWLDHEREQLKQQFFKKGNAAALIAAHAKVIDKLLVELYTCARPKGAKPIAMSVVAVGGYGRRELFPYSDIDLLFVYEPAIAEQAAEISKLLLYVMWDLGLKVGQAHRSTDEAIKLAKEDATICSTLLDARHVAGSAVFFQHFIERFDSEVLHAGNVLEFVDAKLAERDGRHTRFGDSRYMLEPNVKEGKGGLRDLHTLWWLSRYVYPIDTLKDLVKMKLLTAEEYSHFDHSRHFLWNVRAWLHYLSERAEERLTFDRQHAIALHMGFEHPSMNRAIERFMRRYFVAVRTVGSITRIFCALLEEEKKRRPRFPSVWSWSGSWGISPFFLDGERLNVRSEHAFEQDPVLMLELFRVAQDNGLDIHPRALRNIGQNLARIDDGLRSDSRACSIFMDILLSKKGPEVALRRMSEAGVLGRFIPDFGRVVGQTQFNMYHVYTVDEHTLVAVGFLNALELGHMQKEAPLASDLFKRVKMRRVLYLSIFCHDIAKGQGGDHSHLGEKVVSKLAGRLGFSKSEIEMAAWLVRHHLLFTNTAFKRDLNDPKTIADFVEMVQTPERMRLLLILTVADIRAVGPAVWNEWKASLLRDLYTRAEQVMGAGSTALKQHEEKQFTEQLHALLPAWRKQEIAEYLSQVGAGFLAGLDVSRHAAVAQMLRQAKHSGDALLLHTTHDTVRHITEIIICTPDQHGLFSKITGAMALGGANIINAKIFTLKDGMAVEIFQVQDTAGSVLDRPDKLARLSVYIEQAISGQLDLRAALSQRSARSQPAKRSAVQVEGQVFVENDASNIHTVIELTGLDRSGFLYDVTQTITQLGLSIVTAHIATFGTQVADVFYVKDVFGMKVTHASKQKQICDDLRKVIAQPVAPAKAAIAAGSNK